MGNVSRFYCVTHTTHAVYKAADEGMLFHPEPPKKYPREWERLAEKSVLSRLRIHGGWLVFMKESIGARNGVAMTSALTFIPDPNHEWILEDE